ncbi:MAG: FtsW/RodA/SpoVE family cell cycle protein [Oscillospiraceae bacterium]|nr:FtsW/RodA/SpoVE family cell cycle protein [Oscillospiraceae bacterium]
MERIRPLLDYTIKYLKRLDVLLLLMCMTASAFSVYLLYSMNVNGINPSYISRRTWILQLATAGTGTVAALVIAGINYKTLSKFWFLYTPVALLLSLMLFIPGMGMRTENSEEINWLNLGAFQIQPSEFLTIAFIMTFATHLYRLGGRMNEIKHLALLCIHAMVPVGIMVLQKNTGSPILLLFIFVTMLFAAGLAWRYILAGLVAIPGIVWLFWNVYAKEYHKFRILVVLDKAIQEQEIQRYFNQQYLGLMALDSGGLNGQGLFGGDYITMFAIHNDFVFAYVGMTLGFIGCILTLLLILTICIKILTNGGLAKDNLGRLICIGAFSTMFYHTIINVGMVLALTPVVGVPLPLISAGGSSTLAIYIAVGLVMSVRAHREKKYHMFYEDDD